MTAARRRDPAGLGRGPLARRLPVFWQAPADPPAAQPFAVAGGTSPTRFLLQVTTSARRLTVPAAALAVVWQLGEALVPLVTGVAIDRALAPGDGGQLLLWLALLAGVFVALSLGYRFTAQLTAQATQLVQHRLRVTLSRAVLHAEAPAVRLDGGVVSLMTNDVTRCAMVGLTVYPVAELIGVVFIAALLLVIHWPLGLIVLAGAPLTVLTMGRLSGRLARATRVYQTLLADTVGRAADLVAGYRVIKGVRAEAEAARRYRDASGRALDGAWRNAGVLGRFLVGSGTISGVFVAGVAAAAAWFAVAGSISVGELIASVGLAQALLSPMQMVAVNAVPAWAAAVASSGRILDALKATTGPLARSTSTTAAAVPLVELSGHSALRVEPGELVVVRADERAATAVVDAFLHPTKPGGLTVTIDDHPPDTATYRALVTVSPHHAALFSGSAAGNLAAAGAEQRAAAVHAAVHAAGCGDFLDEGLDVEVGEMGNRLSGGQRQRLALARALVVDAPVLVLHEPTTAVDSVTEQSIATALRELRTGRSTVVVSSSPALLRVCDRVVEIGSANG